MAVHGTPAFPGNDCGDCFRVCLKWNWKSDLGWGSDYPDCKFRCVVFPVSPQSTMKSLLRCFAPKIPGFLGALLAIPGILHAQVIPVEPANVIASSEIGGGFNRVDDFLVDGSGLSPSGGHTPTVEGNMWLSRGVAFGGEDLDPSVTFDLGASYRITAIRVWNYNESPPNLTGRGVNAVTVEYGLTNALGNSVPGITNFAQADGTADYAGELFDSFTPFDARFIRFDIDSNHGGDNAFYGLSEVQFEGFVVGVDLVDEVFLSSASQGAAAGVLVTRPEVAGETYTYELVAGAGEDDNVRFQLVGAALQTGDFDFSGSSEGQTFSLRVRSTSSPSGQVVEGNVVATITLDTDSDNLADIWEREWGPQDLSLFSGLGGADVDQDGLTDLEEYNLREQFPLLNPDASDSDLDTLTDGEERMGSGDRPVTDPTNPDTDGDGLSDGVESNSGVFVSTNDTGTDPTDTDSDDDGTGDFQEVVRGSDPNDETSLPTTFLVGYWDFESDVDPQPDRSGFGNDATVFAGASWANDDERGGVMTFDGFDSFLEAADSESLSLLSEMSITAWINVTDFSGFRGIVGKTAGPLGNQPAPYDLYLLANGGQARFFTGTGVLGESTQVTGLSVPTPGEWHHIAVTRIGDQMTVYFDGVQEAQVQALTPVGDGDGSLRIGNRADLVTDFLGSLDDVAIFSGGLSAEEVMEVMNGDFSRFGVGVVQDLELAITTTTTGLRFEWPSLSGKVYDLVSSVDLSSDPATWPVYQANGVVYGGFNGTDAPLVQEGVPLVGPKRFFAIIEKDQ